MMILDEIKLKIETAIELYRFRSESNYNDGRIDGLLEALEIIEDIEKVNRRLENV